MTNINIVWKSNNQKEQRMYALIYLQCSSHYDSFNLTGKQANIKVLCLKIQT